MTQWKAQNIGPRQLKAFNGAIGAFGWESKTFVELHGTHGRPETERRHAVASPCEAARTDAAEIMERIGSAHGYTVTGATYQDIVAEIEAATARMAETRPVHDCRVTAEDVAQRNQAREERETRERAKAEHLARLIQHQYGLAETSRAVKHVLTALFPHTSFSVRSSSYSGGCSIDASWTDGPTQKQVRPILDVFERAWFDGMEDLKHHTGPVEWNGHLFDFTGDYLNGSRRNSVAALRAAGERFSRDTGLPAPEVVEDGRHAYVKRADAPCGWRFFTSQPDEYPEGVLCRDEAGMDDAAQIVLEITHYTSSEAPSVPYLAEWRDDAPEPENSARSVVFRLLLGETARPAAPAPDAAEPARNGVTVSENEEKNGVEIRFPAKPDASVLETLKANGWRWSRFSACWYTKRTPDALAFARSLTA